MRNIRAGEKGSIQEGSKVRLTSGRCPTLRIFVEGEEVKVPKGAFIVDAKGERYPLSIKRHSSGKKPLLGLWVNQGQVFKPGDEIIVASLSVE